MCLFPPALLVAILLVGVEHTEARGGKGAKGAGGSASRYGHNANFNSAAYELTWEDIVLAMQLSAMCFGALFALCIVACCAYKICGPAEEGDFSGRYRSSYKVSRLPPELIREIYTLPPPVVTSTTTTNEEKNTTAEAPSTPTPSSKYEGLPAKAMEGVPYGIAISANSRPAASLPSLSNLPNGRVANYDDQQPGSNKLKGFMLGGLLDGRPRGLTLSSLSSSRLPTDIRYSGAAPRLAGHLNNSTLDLAMSSHNYGPKTAMV